MSTRISWWLVEELPGCRRLWISAASGHKVYLVEKQTTIGGHMLQFDKTFPTLDCAACIGTPKMVEVAQNSNIELLTYSEVKEVPVISAILK